MLPESLLNYRFRGTTMSHSELIVALEAGNMTRVLQWRLERQPKKMERMRAKKETKTSLCRMKTKEVAKESGASAKARTGTRRVAKVAKMVEKKLLAERQR